ncbi:MAG: flippase-like domain-containing protein [Chloroherpetonaceae bacterium]|nr:flippase-like domain-containing protein [Chloroherpetonaceae bacterium]MDW8437131.1 lysylphosphatidylglycerol synthase transmembrane domain-containing protein [Chloroherpetonaceae bacterium]
MKNAIKHLVSIVIAGLFFWLAFKDFSREDIEKLGEIFSRLDYRLIALAFIALTISHVIRAWRWGVLLSSVKEKMSLKHLFNATMIGYAVNLALPRVGEITKAVNLAQCEKIDGKKALASVVVERILDTLMFALLLALSVFIFRRKINEAFGEVTVGGLRLSFELASYLILLVSILALVVFGAMSLYPSQIAARFKSIVHRLSPKWSERLSRALESFIEGAAVLKNRAKYAEIVLSSIVIWSGYLVAGLTPMYAIDWSTVSSFGWAEGLTTMSISAFGSLITPAGAGTYQYACSKTLEKIFDYGLIIASSYALLTFAINNLTSLVLGLASFLWQRKDKLAELSEAKSSERGEPATTNINLV